MSATLIGIIKLQNRTDGSLKVITRTFRSNREFSNWYVKPDLYPDHDHADKKAFCSYATYKNWMVKNELRPIPESNLALKSWENTQTKKSTASLTRELTQ